MGGLWDTGSWIWDHTLGPVVGGVADGLWSQVVRGLVGWVTDAVAWFVGQLLVLLNKTGEIDLTAGWFSGDGHAGPDVRAPYLKVTMIAGVLLVAFMFLGIIQGLLKGAPGEMLARMARDLPLAVLGMVATVSVTQALVVLTDEVSLAILKGSGDDAKKIMEGLGHTGALTGSTFVIFLLGLLAIVAALFVWIELVVRAALVYLLVALSPLAFAATVWPAARGILRKLIELTVAVIFSKVVIAIAFAVGGAALAGAGTAGAPGAGVVDQATASVGTLFAGTVIFVLAAFSPFVVLKLFPAVEAALVAQGVSRGPLRAGQSVASTGYFVERLSGSGEGGSLDAAEAGSAGGAGAAGGAGGGAGGAGAAAAGAAAVV
jgi:hypothetical protein